MFVRIDLKKISDCSLLFKHNPQKVNRRFKPTTIPILVTRIPIQLNLPKGL